VSVMTDVSRDQVDRIPDPGVVPEQALPDTTGDHAFAQLVKMHGPALLSFLLWLTHGDPERSEDIYQETLLRAWRHPECYQQGAWSSRKWLFTVAQRISIDQLRAAAVRPVLVSDARQLDVTCDPVDHFDRMLLIAEVRAAMATLSAAHREVLREMYLQDRPAAQIAERLDLPEGTVRRRAVRQETVKHGSVRAGRETPPGYSAAIPAVMFRTCGVTDARSCSPTALWPGRASGCRRSYSRRRYSRCMAGTTNSGVG